MGVTAVEVIEGFSIAGLLGTLDPVMFGDFLSNYNRLYPTGLGPSLADTLTSIISYVDTMSLSTTAFKKQQSDAFRSTTQEQELYGLLTKVIASPKGAQQLASSINRHPQKTKLLALISGSTKSTTLPSTPAHAADPSKTTSDPAPLPAQDCLECKVKFVPLKIGHKLCQKCQANFYKKAASATIDESTPDGSAALTAIYSLAASEQPRSLSTTATSIKTPPGYWDNGSSVHTTCDFSNILEPQQLAKPFWIGGYGSGLQAIAKGFHPNLPRDIATIYHTPGSNLTLFSIGHLVRRGYETHQSNGLLTVSDPTGLIIDQAPLAENNLSPISSTLLGYSTASDLFMGTSPANFYAAAFAPGWSPYMEDVFKPICEAFHKSVEPDKFFTPEEIQRCHAVEDLHSALSCWREKELLICNVVV